MYLERGGGHNQIDCLGYCWGGGGGGGENPLPTVTFIFSCNCDEY